MSVATDALKRQRDKLKMRGHINQAMTYHNAIQIVQRAEKEATRLQSTEGKSHSMGTAPTHSDQSLQGTHTPAHPSP